MDKKEAYRDGIKMWTKGARCRLGTARHGLAGQGKARQGNKKPEVDSQSRRCYAKSRNGEYAMKENLDPGKI